MKYFNKIINENNVDKAVSMQIFNIIILGFFVFFIAKVKNNSSLNFFHLGPSNNNVLVDIFGLNIDSWKKWIYLIIFLLIFEGINTFSHKIYKNWYWNYVQDPKSDSLNMNKRKAFQNIIIFRIITEILKYFKWGLLIVTKQFQFILPQYIIKLILSLYIDYSYLDK